MTKKEQRELIITGVAVLAFIILLANTFSKIKAKEAKPRPSVEQPVGPGVLSKKEPLESERKDKEWGRDPFLLGRIAPEEGTPLGLVLNGIIWDETEPYAIINDEVVRKGDKIGVNKVIDIKENEVVLDNGEEEFSLTVWE